MMYEAEPSRPIPLHITTPPTLAPSPGTQTQP